MERYVGMDVHAESCSVTVRKASGKVIRRDIVETNGQALTRYLETLGGNLHLCVEECEWSNWLADVLMPHVAEFVVVQPERRRGSKSDRIDADGLSERIRTGKLGRTVFKDRGCFTELREFGRAYTMISKDVTRTKNRIKSFCRGRGMKTPGTAVYDRERSRPVLTKLPSATEWAVELLQAQLHGLEELKQEAKDQMVGEARTHPIYRVLKTAPGFGPVRVAQLMRLIVTPHRFRTKRQLWKYSGFAIVTVSSSDWVQRGGRWVRSEMEQTRGLNRDHNRLLKDIFKGAAITALHQSEPNPLRVHYDRLLANGTKPNLAKLTIARKIAAIVLTMWKKEEVYQPELVGTGTEP
ncbi:MAG: transposase [Gemmatimonadota bacterium]|jgi:transposase